MLCRGGLRGACGTSPKRGISCTGAQRLGSARRGFSRASAAVCSMKAAAPRLNTRSPGPVRAFTDPARRQRSSPGRQHVQKVSLAVL